MASSKYTIPQRLRRFVSSGWNKFIIGREKHRTVVREGITYQIPYVGVIAKSLIHNRLHDVSQWSYLHDQVQLAGSELFIDIGAHFGTFSLRMASTGLVKKVYAVEGARETFRMLCNHIQLNDFGKQIIAINAVAHHRNEDVLFYEDNFVALSGWSGTAKSHSNHIIAQASIHAEAPSKIRGIPIDQLFSFRDRTIAVKIDVEGHELNVLQGGKELFRHNRVFLQIEIWPWNSHTLNWLYENGFKIVNRIDDDYFLVN